MRHYCLVLVGALLASIAMAQAQTSVLGTEQAGDAKQLSVKISCGSPREDSIVETNGIWAFTLHPGDIGKCVTDTARIPNSERAEITSSDTRFAPGSAFRVSTKYMLEPAAGRFPITTIMQIHQWKENCNCGPVLMMYFDGQGRLIVQLLKTPVKYHRYKLAGWNRRHFSGKWVDVALDVTAREGLTPVKIYLNGAPVLEENMFIQEPDSLYFKAGLYRGQHKTRVHPIDRAYLVNPTIAPLTR